MDVVNCEWNRGTLCLIEKDLFSLTHHSFIKLSCFTRVSVEQNIAEKESNNSHMNANTLKK